MRQFGQEETARASFPSRRGGNLVGILHQGRRGAGGVILCHGMESSKEGTKSVRLASQLAASGFHALRFDFSYVGESDGEFADLTVSGEVEDLAGAWCFMRARTVGPIGIVGSSLGGTVALLFAAGEPGVHALATIAAVAHPARLARALSCGERERWYREGLYDVHGMRLRPSFLEDVESIDLPRALGHIRCPLLVTHGRADAVVPASDAAEIASLASGPTQLLVYDGADHRFSEPVLLDRLLADIADWMALKLQASSDAVSRAGQQ